MGRIIYVTGGARSGKSRHAEETAATFGTGVVYLATMTAGDEELTQRIARHRERRPATWQTVEEPLDLPGALAGCPPAATVLLDCLSMWVSNILFAIPGIETELAGPALERFIDDCQAATGRLLDAQRDRPGTLIVVSNEVGLGIVPIDALSRAYRDALGLVNQQVALASDEAVMLVSGLPVRLK